ncbi:MAG: hypothetical protein KJN76_04775 [Eudoraea sp.]|nr:hypothetical protein [Eudoraea sp.]
MQDLPALHLAAYIISFIGQLIVLIGCIVLFVKQRTLATALMLAGMLLSVVFGIMGFFMNFVAAGSSPEALLRNQGIFSTLNTLSYLLFGIGLLLLALKWSRKRY